MSISKLELMDAIAKIAPERLAEEWDNCGMQVDLGAKEISKILIALDLSKQVIAEALSREADLIITHHPLIFGGIKKVDNKDVTGSHVIELIRAGISVYSAHTSFDRAWGGNNDYLAELLKLSNIRGLPETAEEPPIGRTGEFAEEGMDFSEVFRLTEKALSLPKGRLLAVGEPDMKIKKVGICTGAGGDLMKSALLSGCDLFITGEVRHHEALWAKEARLCLLSAGHFGTEWIFRDNFADKLRKRTRGAAEIITSETEDDPLLSLE